MQDNLKRAAAAELSWPLPGDLTDDALESRLFARAGVKQGLCKLPEPNLAELAVERARLGERAVRIPALLPWTLAKVAILLIVRHYGNVDV